MKPENCIPTKQLDQKIEDVKLSGQLLVSRFADMLEIEAKVLKEKKIDGSDLYRDSKMQSLRYHNTFSTLS